MIKSNNASTNNASLSVRNLVISRNHPLIKRIRSLHRRDERDKAQKYYIEGMRFVAQAIESSTHIDALVYAPDLIKHLFAKSLIHQQRKAGMPCFALSAEVMRYITLGEDSQGIGAIVHQQWQRLKDINPVNDLCWIVLQTVQSPGNLGTMLRTSEAVGGAGVILLDNYIDPYDPATVRATMAAMFRQKFMRTTLPQLLVWKEQHGCELIGTSLTASQDYRTVEYSRPTLLFMGGERKGLSQKYQDACDKLVKIPMVGHADSLNLAIATGVMLYEIFHQRNRR